MPCSGWGGEGEVFCQGSQGLDVHGERLWQLEKAKRPGARAVVGKRAYLGLFSLQL